MNRLSYSLVGLCCVSALVWSCVAGGGDTQFEDGGDDGAGGSQSELFEVYGHGPNELYKLDPTNSNLVSLVGPFSGCESGILDIAIDKDNNILGVSAMALWSINRSNGSCTKIADGDFPNSLSFVPAGTLDQNVEALVGYKLAQYIRIDPSTGVEETINGSALTGGMTSSGDVVSIDGGAQGNRTYLTVQDTAACMSTDCLVEINPVTGAIVQNFGNVGYDQVFGLAFWGGSAYGFTRGGAVFEITFNGSTVSSAAVTLAGLSVDEFWGAGSSTLVPLLPPQ
jgi:hypothetical protein